MKKFIFTLIAVFTAISFTACSDNDGEPSSSANISGSLAGVDLKLSHGFWYIDKYNCMILEFYNYPVVEAYLNHDTSLIPEYVNMLAIMYDIPESQTAIESVTLPNDYYEIYIVEGATKDSEGWQSDDREEDNPNNSSLEISRNGDIVSVKIGSVFMMGEENNDIKELKFNFTGILTPMPKELQEDYE